MTLLNLRDGQLAYGDFPLLDHAELSVQDGERIGLIGRNGTGKSTLLKVLTGAAVLDDGAIERQDGLRIAFVEQEPVLPAPPAEHDWKLAMYLERFEVDLVRAAATGSGGERKRAALAAAFASQPDLLLLDEPTNHLDIGAIETLQDLIPEARAALIITHDREFLDRIATRIVELDRGVLRSYQGNFARYQELKEAELASESASNARFDKRLAQEEVWIRKGVEARRTRNEGRVVRLEQLRRERAARRERVGRVNLQVDTGERSGKLVAELEDVCLSFGERKLIDRLSARVMRGDRVGLIGANGAGKSTLIRLILGTQAPDSGTVRLGTNLNIAYFDQMRAALDPERTVADTISPGSDWVEIAGQRKHISSYLQDFLFSPRRAQSPVRMLSGGERNRLLLARLFARPANLLVLDEPTNDLDIDSLELLEQTLAEYPGTVLLVSHDRRFLDNIVTQTIAAEGHGRWREYVGGYSDWLSQRAASAAARAAGAPSAFAPVRPTPLAAASRAPLPRAKSRLGYKDQRELEVLPGQIETLEAEQTALLARMSSPQYHQSSAEEMRADSARAAAIEQDMARKFARWEQLEQMRLKSG
ncbi:MAG TPA: ATP-binding cassette domain-containing protein [Steroidobacteraceae bacterium]|jgi:ATP-binding cassette subfamily F protein uup|nr:ATP-binding cassette domain-containing protein [Steroidobacteraceae bacterium]